MTFPAMFAYPPNEAAALFLAREVLPHMAGHFEELELVLVGRNPTEAMLEAASTDARVVVTGAVPDVRPYLAEAGAVPMPLFDGSGTRLKALEAFAAGAPVVSTAKGLEGLEAMPEVHYLRAEDAGEFVDAADTSLAGTRDCGEAHGAGPCTRGEGVLVGTSRATHRRRPRATRPLDCAAMSGTDATDHYEVNRPEVVDSVVDGEVVAISLSTGSYYNIAGSGTDVWTAFDRPATVQAVVDRLTDRYDAPADEIERRSRASSTSSFRRA